jgi:transglutaminase-like putative cysteine protease
MIQSGNVRAYQPHQPYDEIPPWEYDLDWAGGRTNWFENVNYTDLPLDQPLPDDILEQLENVLFIAEPDQPPQLWRNTAFDRYDGSSWAKTQRSQYEFTGISQQAATSQGNTIYTIYLNISVGPNVGSIQLPTIFPEAQILQDSFRSDPPGRIDSYNLTTDEYGTVRFSPLLLGDTNENVLVSYNVTYTEQDQEYVANNAVEGNAAPADIYSMYADLSLVGELTPRVQNEIDQFRDVGDNAYQKARAVEVYFRDTYELIIDEERVNERPPDGREVTDWFIERGGGLPRDFATAYCVFMRDLGIPARTAMGYALGDAQDGYRIVRVRHMLFYAEVFIPLQGGGGEWIQVIPISLPDNMGGGELPANSGEGNVSLYVFPPQWSLIGEPFNLSSLLLVNDLPVTRNETIVYRDETDNVLMGTAEIEQGTYLPLANITYTFPDNASIGSHNISATWYSDVYSVSNFTTVYAVGEANPLSTQSVRTSSDFVPSETTDVNIKLGLDNYTTHWEDILHVYGTLTVKGQPVDGTTLDNDQMQIMWDELFYGNATIQSDGHYEIDIYVDPADLIRMTTGDHLLWAQYAGEYDSETGFPIILPGRSEDNSTVEVRGHTSFGLSVSPTDTYAGSTLTYEGVLELLNGTPLVGETVGIILNDTLVATTTTNSSGGYIYDYGIPWDYPAGTVYAQVNWTSGLTLVDGNTSAPISVIIRAGITDLTIDSSPRSPDPVHIFEDITIYGYLTDASNGTPLAGRTIDIWWEEDGGPVQIGSNTTTATGYYELVYTVPSGYEGQVTYWSEFSSAEPYYQSSRSVNLSITVKKYDVIITISATPDPVSRSETVRIEGLVVLPEIPALLQGAHLTIWWQNSTGTHNITGTYTNTTGGYLFDYSVPIDHELATIRVWTEFISPTPALASNESQHISLSVSNYASIISVNSNSTIVHLNESILIYGNLHLNNGTPLAGYTVEIQWDNGSVYSFLVVTNASGDYSFIYNFSLSQDSEGIVDVQAIHNSIDSIYNSSSAWLIPSLTVQLYQLDLTGNVNATQVHQDEALLFSGTLSFIENSARIAGETISIFYDYGNGTISEYFKITDSSGGYSFLYNYSLADALGAIYIWAEYTSTNPLWDNSTSPTRTVQIILYSLDLTTTTNSSSYYVDQVVFIYGQLSFTNNGTGIPNEQVRVFWNNGTDVIDLGFHITNSTGYYNVTVLLSPQDDSPGDVTIWADYFRSNPLWDNATSSPGTIITLQLYQVVLDISISPNPVYLNETVTITAHLYFVLNGSDISGAEISLWWYNGSDFNLVTLSTNTTGEVSFAYDKMDEDTILSVEVYAVYTGTNSIESKESVHQPLTLQRWSTAFSSISTGGTTSFHLTETIVVSGTLYYDDPDPDVPYGGVTVEILVDGIVVNTTISASDGSFTSYWTIPASTTPGTYDLTTRFISSENWISGTVSAPIAIDVDAYQLVWTLTLNSALSYPITAYRGELLTISGTLELDDGTPYGGQTVDIYWISVGLDESAELVVSIVTQPDGSFQYQLRISDTETLGLKNIWANCTPTDSYVTSGESAIRSAFIEQIPVSLTVSANVSLAYLGDTITINGTLTFGNGTPIVDEDVEIFWNGELIATLTVEDSINGSYVHYLDLPYYEDVGLIALYARFVQPSEAYSEAETSEETIEVRDSITITLDTQETTVVNRGDSLEMSGTVVNDGGGIGELEVELLVNGTLTGLTTTTDSSGNFLLTIFIESDQAAGSYNLSVIAVSTYRELSEASDYWIVDVHLRSIVSIVIDTADVVLLGENLTVSVNLVDEDGNSVGGEDVEIYLNNTLVETVTLSGTGLITATIDITTSWDGGSGHFVARAVFGGMGLIDASEDISDSAVHIVVAVEIIDSSPSSVLPDSSFSISGRLLDDQENPIAGRRLRIYLNSTSEYQTTSTDENGAFAYSIRNGYPDQSRLNYIIALHTIDGIEFERVPGTVLIEALSGPTIDTVMMMFWTIAIVAEIVVGSFVLTRYRSSGGPFSRGIGIEKKKSIESKKEAR